MHEQNLDMYGHRPIPWSRALKQLEAQAGEEGPGRTCWLATADPDGRPHLAAVGAIWVDGKFYSLAGLDCVKAENSHQIRAARCRSRWTTSMSWSRALPVR